MSPEIQLLLHLQNAGGRLPESREVPPTLKVNNSHNDKTQTGLWVANGQRPQENSTSTGLWIPEGTTETQPFIETPVNGRRLPLFLREDLSRIRREKEIPNERTTRPKEYREYLLIGPDGEERFNFETVKHQAALDYINGNGKKEGEQGYIPDTFESFKIHTDKMLAPFVKDGETIDEVRKTIWKSHHMFVHKGAILVPNDYHVPNIGEGHYAEDFFYWDNLWSLKFAAMRNQADFSKGVVDNFKVEYRALGYNPNSNKLKIANRSQSNVGALMFREVDKVLTDTPEDQEWRNDTINFLKSEYFSVLVYDPEGATKYDRYEDYTHGPSPIGLLQRGMPKGASRYVGADIPGDHYAAECASSEDCTPRFGGKAADYNATDLAGLKATYEKLFAEEAFWQQKLQETYTFVNQEMWNEEKGWYMDYNHVTKKQSPVMALAAFLIPLSGLAPRERLGRMVDTLDKFQLPYGLATTTGEEDHSEREGEQWKYPNVWSPREDFVFDTLMEYPEYHDKLEEMMIKSMIGCAEFHANHGTMPETRNGLTAELGGGSMYPRETTHKGFCGPMWCIYEIKNDFKRFIDKEMATKKIQFILHKKIATCNCLAIATYSHYG